MGWTYRPLQPNEIRLLKPLRGASATLSFEIIHVPLSSKPKYAALSYTWGKPGDTHQILLNGQTFPIRKNLHDALVQLSTSKLVEKYLWVDAICIDQATNADAKREKSVQLILMTQIYEEADKVFAWLGLPEDETNNQLAFQKIAYFNKLWVDNSLKDRPYQPWCDTSAKFLLSIQPAKDKRLFDEVGSLTHRAWLGIIALWRSPWWTRTWIFQESTIPEKFKIYGYKTLGTFRSARKVLFLCGNEKTTWDALGSTYMVAETISGSTDVDAKFLVGAARSYSQLMRFRTQRNLGAGYSFADLLQLFRHTGCADPRDKVYAPFCLASDDVRRCIRPEYDNTTTLDVYTDVVRYYLTSPGHELDFLGCVLYAGEAESVQTPEGPTSILPSWVPNFAIGLNVVPIPKLLHVPEDLETRRMAMNSLQAPTYSGPRVPAYRPLGATPSRSFIDGNILHVRGVYIDYIKDLIPNKGPDMEAVRAFARQKGVQWATEMEHQYFTGVTWGDAANSTIVLDLVYDYFGRPAERGGRHDAALRKRPKAELTAKEYRMQMNMNNARIQAGTSKNFGLSQKFYLLMIPMTAVICDQIWALCGGQVLYALRAVDRTRKQYHIIGECYAHGLMDGEILRRVEVGELEMEDICLI